MAAGFRDEAYAMFRPGGSVNTSGTALTASQFKVTNWNASGTSPGFIRLGMPFKPGDVPSGSTLAIYNGASLINSQFDQRSTWPDGSFWKNANGTIADFEYAAVVSQDRWDAPNKYLLAYNANLQDGATVIQTYSSVQHPYHSQWLTATMTADNNAGRRFWVTKIPTLGYQPSQAYWVNSGVCPPLNYSAPITFGTNSYTAPYVPCQNMNVNAAIDTTGGSNGRGIFMDSDCWAFLSQRQSDVVKARVTALSGLGVPYHCRSNAMRTRPQDSGVSDIASSVMSLIMLPNSSSYYDFTSQGMPAAVHAYRGSATATMYTNGYVTPLGGSGVWTPSSDTSHASSYCFFTYMLEGERHFLECLGDLNANGVQGQNGNQYAGIPNLLYYAVTSYQTAFSIPSTVYSAISNMLNADNTRATGWAYMLLGIAASMYPDLDAQGNVETSKQYFVVLNQQNTNYCVTSMNYMPAAQISAGWWRDNESAGPGSCSPWMQAFIAMGALFNYTVTQDTNAGTMAMFMANHSIGLYTTSIYRTCAYRAFYTPSAGGTAGTWNATTNNYFPISQMPIWGLTCSVASSGSLFTITAFNMLAGITNGDSIWIGGEDPSAIIPSTVPSEVTQGKQYYIISASGSGVGATFQISTTVGGSPVIFSNNYTGVAICWNGAQMAAYTVSQNPPLQSFADDYPPIHRTVLAFAKRAGKTGAATALATAQTFLTNTDAANYTASTGQYFAWQMAA